MIYLDNSATAKPDPDVIDLMREVALNMFGNPSSIHNKGSEAERVLKQSRLAIMQALCGGTDDSGAVLVFTSGGTESNNQAVKGYFTANPRKGRTFVTTKVEHASIIQQADPLAKMGVQTIFLENDGDGRIDLDDLRVKITGDTGLVSIMMVNNEIGTVQPIDEAVKIIKKQNPETVIHVDAVQAFGKIPLNPRRSGIDMLSVCAHKLHGPRGIGALYFKKGLKLAPLLDGGGQEGGLRSGTENVAGAAAFARAAQKYSADIEVNMDHVRNIGRLFVDKLSQPYVKISPDGASPYILSLSFPGLKSETILHKLETEGVYASAGSACHSRNKAASHVLKAIGLPEDRIGGTIRISFSASTTADESISAAEILNNTVGELYSLGAKSRKGTKNNA